MKVEQILKFIPEKDLDFLSLNTSVDRQIKKLKGSIIFKLILFSMLNSSRLSLRVMESFLMSTQFKKFSGTENLSSKYNSIRDRITTINSKYFEKIFELVFIRYNTLLNEKFALTKVDSTFINLSSKLLKWGMDNGTKSNGYKYIKFTVSVKGSLPCNVQIYKRQDFVNENIALPDAILKNKYTAESVVVFDRGLQTRKKFDEFSENSILFVGRIKTDVAYKLLKSRKVSPQKTHDTVDIIEDLEVYLFTENHTPTKNKFRVVKAIIKTTQQEIYFVSNFFEATAYEIAAIYRQRWEIEVFFKFLKQNLNLKHIVSRNENAVSVMLYMTMILAILLIVYRKENKIGSYKIAKLRFEIELDNLMIKEIVVLCGGNPNKAAYLWNSS